MDKKFYEAPEMEIVKLGLMSTLLNVSDGGEGDPGGLNDPDAPAPKDDY